MNTINNSGVVEETTNAEATFKLNFAPQSFLTSSTCHLMYSVLLILHHISRYMNSRYPYGFFGFFN